MHDHKATADCRVERFLTELNEFSNLGKGLETMKVPYAKKWQKETERR
jgi:hypothetical protein